MKKAVTRYVSQRNGVTAWLARGRWSIVVATAGLFGSKVGKVFGRVALPNGEQRADSAYSLRRASRRVSLVTLVGEFVLEEPGDGCHADLDLFAARQLRKLLRLRRHVVLHAAP